MKIRKIAQNTSAFFLAASTLIGRLSESETIFNICLLTAIISLIIFFLSQEKIEIYSKQHLKFVGVVFASIIILSAIITIPLTFFLQPIDFSPREFIIIHQHPILFPFAVTFIAAEFSYMQVNRAQLQYDAGKSSLGYISNGVLIGCSLLVTLLLCFIAFLAWYDYYYYVIHNIIN